MKDEDVIKHLTKEAPNISWTIEDGTIERGSHEHKGKVIRGAMTGNGEELAATMPITYNKDMLNDIAEGFKRDYERKMNAIL